MIEVFSISILNPTPFFPGQYKCMFYIIF